MKNAVATLFLLAFGATFAGCSDDVQDVIDCIDVCDRYKDCVDDDFDVDDCVDRCEDAADDSDAWRDRLRDCSDCIDDRSCASATFVCSLECAGIVP
jgi:hypothetical protein